MSNDSNYWDSWWRARTSRRNILRAAGGLSAAGFLAACAPASTTAPTGASQAPAAPSQGTTEGVAQVYRHAASMPPVTLDPNGTASSAHIFYAIYDALTRVDEQANVLPGLAESWKATDATTWEFKIRAGAKWSDGSPATADDVKFTYDYVLDTANKSAIASRIANVTGVTVVDPQTVRISTKGSDPLMAKRAYFIPILPKAYIAKVGWQQFSLNPIGTGGFKIKEYKQGTRAVLVPSETSWRKPKLTELQILEIPDATARLAGLRTGDLDAIDGLDRENADRMKGEPSLAVIVADGVASYNFDLEFFAKPYDDKRVRIAMNHAIDKNAILKGLLLGFGKVMDGQLVPSNVFGYNPNLKPYEYDPKKAKDLLAAAGLSNGFETAIEFTTTSSEPKLIAQAMAQNLQDVGIKSELRAVEIAVWRDHIYNGGRPPLFYNPWSAAAPQDADFILNWYGASSFNGKPYWKNDAFEAAYSKSQSELDPQKRLGFLQAASAAMHDDPPVIFGVQTTSLWGINKKVKNFVGATAVWFDDIQIVKV